ncbi:hypothetical protein MLD38_020426 [Melastoma candidum]|uniref:Uncharacterized protein n=1 Tax=Melastoma candidum TaxID=119954 RepID=A0ACB9QD04_9MYRT|nr:hypothetical protein MLD38_020426 [Melastoma candidum]
MTMLVQVNSGHQLIPPGEGSRCRGPIADCSPGWVEFGMESEPNRRILATSPTKHISYRALMPGTTPCSLRGKSYYNCSPGATNPYQRSCSVITRCRS